MISYALVLEQNGNFRRIYLSLTVHLPLSDVNYTWKVAFVQGLASKRVLALFGLGVDTHCLGEITNRGFQRMWWRRKVWEA